ncbi:hypothetical protein, partial [Roseibium hamelinense]|uniref:hypothetical protein n=1 Tax=Roseibium hamelinense TaxID=150831 RepID=UPI001AD8EEDA
TGAVLGENQQSSGNMPSSAHNRCLSKRGSGVSDPSASRTVVGCIHEAGLAELLARGDRLKKRSIRLR